MKWPKLGWKNITIGLLVILVFLLGKATERGPIVSTGSACSGPDWGEKRLVFQGYTDDSKGLSFQMLWTTEIFQRNPQTLVCYSYGTGVSRGTGTVTLSSAIDLVEDRPAPCRVLKFDPKTKEAMIDSVGAVYSVSGSNMSWERGPEGQRTSGRLIPPCER